MSSVKVINITIVAYSSIITLIIILCLLANRSQRTRLNRLLAWILICQLVVLVTDGAIYIGENIEGWYGGFIVRASNFFVYVFGYLLLAIFTDYLVTYLSSRVRIYREIVWTLYGICAVGILLVIVSQFNHMYYYTDAQNIYHRGSWFWLSQSIAILCMVINFGIIIKHRRSCSRVEFAFLLSYVLIPAVALTLQILIDGPYFVNGSVTLGVLVLYAGVQTEQSKFLAQKDSELEHGRVQIMLSQIQPHFLYNALSAIAMLCDTQPAEAKTAIIDFSAYLRGNMDSLKLEGLIAFQKELEHTEVYLSLEKMRFGNELSVEYRIETTDFFLPPLTLQPIVENAVRYGVGKKEEGGTVTISAREAEGAYWITVTDDGVGYDMTKPQYDGRTHIGIDNVRQRLKMQCAGELEIDSVVGRGTTATIRIPKGDTG